MSEGHLLAFAIIFGAPVIANVLHYSHLNKYLESLGAVFEKSGALKGHGTIKGIPFAYDMFDFHMDLENLDVPDIAFNHVPAVKIRYARQMTSDKRFNLKYKLYTRKAQDVLYFTPAVNNKIRKMRSFKITGRTWSWSRSYLKDNLKIALDLIQDFNRPVASTAETWLDAPDDRDRDFARRILVDTLAEEPETIEAAQEMQRRGDVESQLWAFQILQNGDPQILTNNLKEGYLDTTPMIDLLNTLPEDHPFKEKAQHILNNALKEIIRDNLTTPSLPNLAAAVLNGPEGFERISELASQTLDTRADYAIAYAFIGSEEPRAEAILLPLLQITDNDVQFAAVKALATCGGPKAMEKLHPMLKGGLFQSSLSQAAEKAMDLIRSRHAHYQAGMLSVHESDELQGALSQPGQDGELTLRE